MRAIVALVLVTSILFAACSPANSSQAAVTNCTTRFEATVRQGPDAGLALAGDLRLQVDASGSVKGTLQESNGTTLNVTGQANGRALNLALELGGGQWLFGVGTLQNEIRQCKGAGGGSLVGPKPADIGDWGYGLGG